MNSDTRELISLIEDYLYKLDEEMEHGCYGAPVSVPYQYEDEDDYYGEHERITYSVVESRNKLEDKIKELRNK